MNKIIVLVFAFVITASIVMAAAANPPNLSLNERVKAMEADRQAMIGNLTERREAMIENLSERREAMLQNITERIGARINATMNYGQCVSDTAKAKNGCFNATNEKSKTCAAAATNKTMKKGCKTEYNKGMDECKKAFKDAKKNECGKIKATFMEKLWNSWR